MWKYRTTYWLIAMLLCQLIYAQDTYLPLLESENRTDSNEAHLVSTLRTVPDMYDLIQAGTYKSFDFDLPVEDGVSLRLHLRRLDIIDPEGLLISNSNGSEYLDKVVGGFYTGTVMDRPHTDVTLSVLDDEIMLRVILEDGSGYKLYKVYKKAAPNTPELSPYLGLTNAVSI